MSAQHTPGPWQVLPEEVDKPYIRVRGTVLGGRHKVANVLTPIYDGVHEREAKETRANALLIAAAPDLVRVLRMARKQLASNLQELADCHTSPATGLVDEAQVLLILESEQDLIDQIDAVLLASGAA